MPKDADPIEDEPIADCTYERLSDELRMHFDTYPLDVVIVDEADEDEIREMFLRLQNGTTLKAQEKRNAYPGRMRDYVKSLAEHKLFNSVNFSNARYTYDLIAAQLVCLELAGQPSNVKNADLNRMYDDHRDFDSGSAVGRAVVRVLGMVADAFPEKTPELTRYNVVALYCVIAELLASHVVGEFKPLLHEWFLAFERMRSEQEQLSEDEADTEWVTYKEKISHSTDTADSIKWRTDFMLRSFLLRNQSLSRKDQQRTFTEAQRIAVFRRDRAICQLQIKCSGEKVKWDDWHCDHKVSWSKGGPTTVENGQVACSPCNLSKGGS